MTDFYNCSVKIYPDGTFRYVLSLNRVWQSGFSKSSDEFDDCESFWDSVDLLEDSGLLVLDTRDYRDEANKRAIQQVFDYSSSNDWDLFITLTFDPSKVDSYDYNQCSLAMQSFTRYLRDLNCSYLLVPEQHKSGRYHFHGLLKYREGRCPILVPAHDKNGNLLFQGDTQIYNLPRYQLGFSTASYVKDQARVSHYISKYITKDLVVPPFKKRYWTSRGLNRPFREMLLVKGYPDLTKVSFSKKIHTDFGDFLFLESSHKLF